jgi:hypothetical protein
MRFTYHQPAQPPTFSPSHGDARRKPEGEYFGGLTLPIRDVTLGYMRGPKTPTEALAWIKEAVREGRYTRTKHLFDRISDRMVSLLDVVTAIRRGARAEPHSESPRHGGTC